MRNEPSVSEESGTAYRQSGPMKSKWAFFTLSFLGHVHSQAFRPQRKCYKALFMHQIRKIPRSQNIRGAPDEPAHQNQSRPEATVSNTWTRCPDWTAPVSWSIRPFQGMWDDDPGLRGTQTGLERFSSTIFFRSCRSPKPSDGFQARFKCSTRQDKPRKDHEAAMLIQTHTPTIQGKTERQTFKCLWLQTGV